MKRATLTAESLINTFLHGGRLLGLPLGVCYVAASTLQRSGLSPNAFLSVNFLVRFIAAVAVGFFLAGAWELLSEVMLRRYKYDQTAEDSRLNLVEAYIRYGLPLSFFLAFATTFGKDGLSLDPFLWLSFLFSLVLYLLLSFLVICVFGALHWGTSKILRPRAPG